MFDPNHCIPFCLSPYRVAMVYLTAGACRINLPVHQVFWHTLSSPACSVCLSSFLLQSPSRSKSRRSYENDARCSQTMSFTSLRSFAPLVDMPSSWFNTPTQLDHDERIVKTLCFISVGCGIICILTHPTPHRPATGASSTLSWRKRFSGAPSSRQPMPRLIFVMFGLSLQLPEVSIDVFELHDAYAFRESTALPVWATNQFDFPS